MKIKDCIAFAKCVRNPDSPLTVDAQTVHGESSTKMKNYLPKMFVLQKQR